MTRIRPTAALLAALLFLTACTPSATVGESTDTTAAPAESTVPATETDAPADGFEAVRASSEPWLGYGLTAYLAGADAPDLTDFFAEPANLGYLTLYADSFAMDPDKAVPVAEAFFRFVVETAGKEALTDVNRRVELKTAYLASLGLATAYPQLPEVEAVLARMTLSSEKEWPHVLTLDQTSYYFKDFSEGSATQYRALIFHNTTGLARMIDRIKQALPDAELHTDRHFHYYMTFDEGSFSHTTTTDGKMYIQSFTDVLHESMHAMGLFPAKPEDLWLAEGLCDYFGKLLGFNEQLAVSCMQIFQVVESGILDEPAAAGDPSSILYKRVYDEYVAAGGQTDTAADFDLILYNDLMAALQRPIMGEQLNTIGSVYEALNGKHYDAPGMELSYAEAASLVSYLVETYTLETVMRAYETEDIEGTLGKTYEELAALWTASLPVVPAPLSNRP